MREIINDFRFSFCPLCKSNEIQKFDDLKYADNLRLSTHAIKITLPIEIWRCAECMSRFTQNAIPPIIAEELYSTGEGTKRWALQSFEQDKTNSIIQNLKSFLKKDQALLDIGCNTGEFLDFSLKYGVKTHGLELCKESCEVIKNKGHIAYYSSDSIDKHFDIITAFDVIEHLYDFNEFMKFVEKIMNPLGYFIILTGNPLSLSAKLAKGKWWYYNYPEHVIFPSPYKFNNIPGFTKIHSFPEYASKQHQKIHEDFNWSQFIKKIISKTYSGLPAISSDHQLIILQKNSKK